jgi:hypothetical protein
VQRPADEQNDRYTDRQVDEVRLYRDVHFVLL